MMGCFLKAVQRNTLLKSCDRGCCLEAVQRNTLLSSDKGMYQGILCYKPGDDGIPLRSCTDKFFVIVW